MKKDKPTKKGTTKRKPADTTGQTAKTGPRAARLAIWHTAPDGSLYPPGTLILNREGTEVGRSTGKARPCPLLGCTGLRLEVRWPDGKKTYPCTRGMKGLQSKLQIL